jgi:N12 class adenine-specific DNA methylase
VAQDQQLGILRQVRPDQHRQQAEQAPHHAVDERQQHPRWSQPCPCLRSKTPAHTTKPSFRAAQAPQLAQAVLEQRRIEVRDKINDEAWVLNMEETLAAQEKATELAERFSEWAWENPARAAQLAETYNRLFNDIVLRSYDDAQLSLPGLAMSFEPRAHQVAAVARIISEPAVGLFHEVGAGKTAEMTMGAMELRRLHLARKPAIIVPNHMLEQFSREFLQLYSQAKVLVTQREDLQAGRRRQFVARCATGDWDVVVMSRSAFERIPMSADAQRAYLEAELERMRDFIQVSKEGDGLTVKRLEGALLRAEERLKAKLDSAKDPGITFEATGIDYLFVDEAHGYKNLRTPPTSLTQRSTGPCAPPTLT